MSCFGMTTLRQLSMSWVVFVSTKKIKLPDGLMERP